MTRPQVFQCGPGAPFTDRFQDMLREAMIRDIPKHLRPRRPKDTVTPNTGKARKAAAQRAKDAPVVIRMFERGAMKSAIAKELGVSTFYVDRILEEANVKNRNQSNRMRSAYTRRAEYAPRIMELRATGASHAAIGAAIGLASATVRRIILEQGQ